ncbi:MAG: carbohydrate kinase [Pedobacter sp.]|uniref:carbohydrate kinase family protein n=1 Tax=Pedobacter sp. TaxID=1411316 RepID=UPI0033987E68
MTQESIQPGIICFGEILWDNLPTGRTAGGAPMNVAYHLNRTGAESQLISRLGDDKAGKELFDFSEKIGLPTDLLQTDPTYPTGEVIAKVRENHEVVYDILPDAAWDYISCSEQLKHLAGKADAFVFGSLAARNDTSRHTLLELLESAKFKVLDINLRAPHYSKETADLLLSRADLLKLNSDELSILTDWFYKSGAAEPDCISFLQEKFGIAEIIVTKGGEGASYYYGNLSYSGEAYKVEVADTIGAGDSFLAAFLYKKLTGCAIPETLDYALAMGAFIASQPGACPAYTHSDLSDFIISHERQA